MKPSLIFSINVYPHTEALSAHWYKDPARAFAPHVARTTFPINTLQRPSSITVRSLSFPELRIKDAENQTQPVMFLPGSMPSKDTFPIFFAKTPQEIWLLLETLARIAHWYNLVV